MKVDMHNFQPLAMFNQFTKGTVKTGTPSTDIGNHQIDKNNVATNVVNNRLNEALGMPQKSIENNLETFDFETVSSNILKFVTGAIGNAKDNGASESELKKMLSDAQKGIKEGLADASEELDALGLLSNGIKQGIDETAHQLESGLQSFADDLFDKSGPMTAGSTSYREASHYNLTEDASFKFKTKEGDEVNITFNSDYLRQNASVVNLSDNSLEYASSEKTVFQGAFSFEVNGDLNEDEQQAINDLLGSLQNVSDMFFNGDFDDAFEEAKSISMDPTHLASFSMDLQRTETVVSIKEYQQVMPGKEIAQRFAPVNDELAKAYEQAKPFAIEEHLTELLQWLAPEEQEGKQNFLDYSQAVFDQLSNLASQIRLE